MTAMSRERTKHDRTDGDVIRSADVSTVWLAQVQPITRSCSEPRSANL